MTASSVVIYKGGGPKITSRLMRWKLFSAKDPILNGNMTLDDPIGKGIQFWMGKMEVIHFV